MPSTTIGEAMIGIWLESLGAEHAAATDAGAGWGGDRLSVAGSSDGGYAMAWRIVFDAPAQSEDFERTYGALVDGLPFPARLVRTGDAALLVVHASTDALVDRLWRPPAADAWRGEVALHRVGGGDPHQAERVGEHLARGVDQRQPRRVSRSSSERTRQSR